MNVVKKLTYIGFGAFLIFVLLIGFYWHSHYGQVRGCVSCENTSQSLSFMINSSKTNEFNSLKFNEYYYLKNTLINSYIKDTACSYKNTDDTYDKAYHFSNLVKNNIYELHYGTKKLKFEILKIDTIYNHDGFSLIPECQIGFIKLNNNVIQCEKYVNLTRYDFK